MYHKQTYSSFTNMTTVTFGNSYQKVMLVCNDVTARLKFSIICTVCVSLISLAAFPHLMDAVQIGH
jgi:ABC-type dipeptide/oligopeptide/nickel transport system permease component